MAKSYPLGRTSKWNSEDGLNDIKESNKSQSEADRFVSDFR